jgi:excisionase family DNA binding protein
MTESTATKRPRRRTTAEVGLPEVLSKLQVAEAAGVSERTVDRRVKDGTLKATRLGPRLLRIERASVVAWLGGAA